MLCPRCETEWDVSKSPCPRCGLLVHVPGRSRTRPSTPQQEIPQTPRMSRSAQTGDASFSKQQTVDTSFPKQTSNVMPPVNPQSEPGQPSSRIRSSRQQQGNSAFPTPVNNVQLPITPFPPTEQQPTNRQPNIREGMQQSLPVLPEQEQQYDIPTSSSPLTGRPRPANASSPNYENNPFLARLRKDEAPSKRPTIATGGSDVNENVGPRNVSHRPQIQPTQDRSTENLASDAQRTMRPGRFVTDPLIKERQSNRSGIANSPLSSTTFTASPYGAQPELLSALVPGTLLRGGRYRLRELQGRQDWRDGVFEATWLAQDAQRAGSRVMICELVTPESKSMVLQSTLRNATMALTSVGRHPHIPTLWDAFSDQGRSFFVFEPIEGESLIAHMRRTGRPLPEQDVVECCLQMTELLELLSQQSPQLVHGLIRPEHILAGRMRPEYFLTNFSIILAGGAMQFVTGIDRSYLTPYTAPEFARGMIDGRSDLYSLMATAYHAVTGSMPTFSGESIPQPQKLNPTVSSEFDAILARGLRPTATQRYQRPSELRQDLLAMRSVTGTLSSRSGPLTPLEATKAESPIPLQKTTRTIQPTASNNTYSQTLPSLLSSDFLDDQEQKSLLPNPEDLQPMPERNDFQLATFWLAGILLCLIIVVIVSRGIV